MLGAGFIKIFGFHQLYQKLKAGRGALYLPLYSVKLCSSIIHWPSHFSLHIWRLKWGGCYPPLFLPLTENNSIVVNNCEIHSTGGLEVVLLLHFLQISVICAI